ITGITAFGIKSVRAFADFEKSVVALNTALGTSNHSLVDYAGELQQLTGYSDDALLSSMALIGAFEKDENQIKRLTRVTLDLATAKGMDLKSAADLVAKSIGSSTNALSRYGIEITGAVGSTERLDSAVRGISNLYGGQALAAADTFS